MKATWTCWACPNTFTTGGGLLALIPAHDAQPDTKAQALSVRLCERCLTGFATILRTRRTHNGSKGT